MLDFYFIGTSGKSPLVNRRLSSAMIRSDGDITLIDAGEGTQLGISDSGWTAKAISTILITHLHSDHILGLAGVLLLINNSGREERLVIAGPAGIKKYVNSLYITLPDLKFPIYFIEFSKDEEFIQAGDLEVDAFKVNHGITCYGYSFYKRHPGKFDVDKASVIPQRLWGELSKGYATLDQDGNKVKNSDILGPERKGIKVTYVTDTRPTANIVKYAAYSDLFVCEGMYIGSGETEERDETNKIKYFHMTFLEAATLANHANVNKLLLTHFNPGLINPFGKLGDAREIFKETYAAADNLMVTISFDPAAAFNKFLKSSREVKGSLTFENPYDDYMCFEDKNMRAQMKPKTNVKSDRKPYRRGKSGYHRNSNNFRKNTRN